MKQLWMPPAIRARLQNKPFSENTTGMSGARVLIFEDLVLKIQKDAPWAEREVMMLRWLEGKLPVPDVVECGYVWVGWFSEPGGNSVLACKQ